jgi:hypothetical protein
MSVTRSLPYWSTSVFSFTVTDLVLIRISHFFLNDDCLTSKLLLNHWTPWRIPNDWTLLTELTSRRTEYVTMSYSSSIILFFPLPRERAYGMLPSNGLPLWFCYSGFRASNHNMIINVRSYTVFNTSCSQGMYEILNLSQIYANI